MKLIVKIILLFVLAIYLYVAFTIMFYFLSFPNVNFIQIEGMLIILFNSCIITNSIRYHLELFYEY